MTPPRLAPLRTIALAAVALAAAVPAAAEDAAVDPSSFASSADIRTAVAAMARTMKPGQGFAWQPLVRGDATVAALEYWKKPGRPAVHPDQTEYAVVVAGAGTLVSGGRLDQPVVVKPDLTEGARIIGGTERKLAPGDVVLIPAGTPHWFGITGDRLVLLGTKVAVQR